MPRFYQQDWPELHEVLDALRSLPAGELVSFQVDFRSPYGQIEDVRIQLEIACSPEAFSSSRAASVVPTPQLPSPKPDALPGNARLLPGDSE